jgi:hypothetical protein
MGGGDVMTGSNENFIGPRDGARSEGAARSGIEAGTPSRGVRAVGWLVAAWCVGFAAVNITFEATGHFTTGALADYAGGLSVMDGVVVAWKLLGAAVALASTGVIRAPLSPRHLAVLVWGAAATLGIYTLGTVVEAVGMLAGVFGDSNQITPRSLGYLGAFLLAAVGYAILAVSYSRRHRPGRRPVVLGVLGAPLLLGLVLVVIPALLVSLGIMPTGH